jgi:hypothetical protein
VSLKTAAIITRLWRQSHRCKLQTQGDRQSKPMNGACLWWTNVHLWYPSVRNSGLYNHCKVFHKIWYGCYAMGHYSKFILSNCLHSLIPSLQTPKDAGWDDEDAIIHETMRMRITNVISSPLTRLYEFNTWRMVGRKFITFCMDVMP